MRWESSSLVSTLTVPTRMGWPVWWRATISSTTALNLPFLRLVDHVVHVLADHGTVGGDLHHVQIVNAFEFFFLRLGRAGHAGDFFVHAEVVLEGDGGQRLAFPLHLHVLLGLDGLMQTIGIAAAHHQTAGELVHDDDLAVLHHVVHVPLHEGVGLQRGQNVVVKLAVFHVGDVFHLEEASGPWPRPRR